MTVRDEILSRLKSNHQEMPTLGTHRRAYPDLAAQFSHRLQASAGEVYRVNSLDEALEKMGDLFRELGVETVAAHQLVGPEFDSRGGIKINSALNE